MSSFFVELWEGIFTPGPTPTILKATNISFAALQLVLFSLLIATYSVHFIVLSLICGGLWYSINWFARELKVAEAQQEEEERSKKKKSEGTERDTAKKTVLGGVGSSDDSDTEVESRAVKRSSRNRSKRTAATAAKVDVELVETRGELKQRGESTLSAPGTQSSVSTEDEWEKVSESEKDKDK